MPVGECVGYIMHAEAHGAAKPEPRNAGNAAPPLRLPFVACIRSSVMTHSLSAFLPRPADLPVTEC